MSTTRKLGLPEWLLIAAIIFVVAVLIIPNLSSTKQQPNPQEISRVIETVQDHEVGLAYFTMHHQGSIVRHVVPESIGGKLFLYNPEDNRVYEYQTPSNLVLFRFGIGEVVTRD